MEVQIPLLDFTKDPQDLEEGTEGWKSLSTKVTKACEEYGCFQVAYNKTPEKLRQEMFKALKDLFDLPVETKKKNISTTISHFGYLGKNPVAPLYESLGIENAPMPENTEAFTHLMWPEGNNFFCETVNNMSKSVLEVELIVRKMVFDSYGLRKYYESHAESSQTLLRVMKYDPPTKKNDEGSSAVGLQSHTDKGILAVLCTDEVQGLQVQAKQGHWIHVAPLPGTFTVFVGDIFKAWSNGRLYAAQHKVMMSGEKDRYSFVLFSSPKLEAVTKVPDELVDKDHPLLFRPFRFMDYVKHYLTTRNNDNGLEVFAGL